MARAISGGVAGVVVAKVSIVSALVPLCGFLTAVGFLFVRRCVLNESMDCAAADICFILWPSF